MMHADEGCAVYNNYFECVVLVGEASYILGVPEQTVFVLRVG